MSKKTKIIIGYLCGFISTLLLTLLVSLLIIKCTIYNKYYIKNTLNDYNYYNKVSDEIIEKMDAYMMSSGFPNTILDNIFTISDVKEDINCYAETFYTSNKCTYKTETVKKNIKANINEYLTNHNITANSKSLNNFVKEMSNIYKEEVKHYNTLNTHKNTFKNINKTVDILIISSATLLIITLVILYIIKFEYTISILGASGLIMIFIYILLEEKIKISAIRIITENFSKLLKIFYENILKITLNTGILLIIIEILAIFYKICKKILEKKQ